MFSLSAEDRAFQQEVRDFIDSEFPPDLKAKAAAGREFTRDEIVGWHKVLSRKGWLAPAWPVEHGGTGWPIHRQFLFEEELAVAGCPAPIPFNVKMLGPILIANGSEAQKSHYLPRILACEDWWCQGYSEPGSGSDLASLRTRAVREGDEYVINGSKIWT
ncbi:MAG: acyl-CoA dehydrogenase family protein, partial [Gammaproteobacteria bacterium]|nr:acyl-CoA dehydrogenase family protein [Gammaproteobacteria bacterium]